MDIRGYLSPTTPLTLSATRALTANWQVGQLLQATVLSNPAAGSYVLRIGQANVEAQTTLKLTPGQKLTLEVTQTGSQPVLKLVPAQVNDTLARALRTALPRQQPLAPLLQDFTAAALKPAPQLPAEAVRAVRHLMTQMANVTQVFRAEGLQRAVMNSGVYLEAKLAHSALTGAAPQTQEDFKANLLRLAAALSRPDQSQTAAQPNTAQAQEAAAPKGQPPARTDAPVQQAGTAEETFETPQQKLLHQTEAALARVQTQQVRTLPQENQSVQTWTIELPLRAGERVDVLQLQIQREDERTACAPEALHRWSAWLSFDLEPIGALTARVSVSGDQVSASFWAARAQTAELVQAHLRQLESQLADAGLRVERLSCAEGAPPQHVPAVMAGALVDVNA